MVTVGFRAVYVWIYDKGARNSGVGWGCLRPYFLLSDLKGLVADGGCDFSCGTAGNCGGVSFTYSAWGWGVCGGAIECGCDGVDKRPEPYP